MLGGSIHFFDRPPAPHLTVPSPQPQTIKAPLKNAADHLHQIDAGHTFRFLQLDGLPIARTDKKYPIDNNSPMRHRRQLIRESALKMMQSTRASNK